MLLRWLGLINECGDDIDTTDFEGADSTLWNDPIYQMDLRVREPPCLFSCLGFSDLVLLLIIGASYGFFQNLRSGKY